MAIEMKEDGSTLSEIREALGMAHSAICDAWKAYQAVASRSIFQSLPALLSTDQ